MRSVHRRGFGRIEFAVVLTITTLALGLLLPHIGEAELAKKYNFKLDVEFACERHSRSAARAEVASAV